MKKLIILLILASPLLCMGVEQPSTGPCSASKCSWQPIYDAGRTVEQYWENWISDPYVTVNGPIEDIIRESLKENCACGSTTVSVTRNTSRTHEVNATLSVGAGTLAEASAKLLGASIKGQVHANVDLGTGWTGTWTESWTDTVTKENFEECWRQTYRLKQDKYTHSTAYIEYASCSARDDTDEYWNCGFGSHSGDGQGWTNEVEGWYGEDDCTYPTPPCGS